MKNAFYAIIAAAVLFSAQPAMSATCGDIELTIGGVEFKEIDISGGSATSDVINVDIFNTTTLHIDITDASNQIVNIRLTFEITNEAGGTLRTYPDCATVSPVMTCSQLKIDYNPQAAGNTKSWAIPIPSEYGFFKVTATFTGAGAGDELRMIMRGCYK